MTYKEISRLIFAKEVRVVVGDDDLVIIASEFMSGAQKAIFDKALENCTVEQISIGEGTMGQPIFEVKISAD